MEKEICLMMNYQAFSPKAVNVRTCSLFPKIQLFVLFHYVDFRTEYRVIFFEENWI